MVNACNEGQAATDRGRQAEDAALAMLQDAGLRVLRRNFKTPGRGGGEIDLIMLEPDGTLVFVEVRHRRQMRQGGAAASVDARKQARIVWAARHYLARLRQLPPCRFDVVAFDGHWHAAHPPTPRWIRAAFDAG